MTLLFVDHHDSFVYNLISWFRNKYIGDIIVVQSNNINKIDLKSIRGVIFSPGPGHAKEYPTSLEFLKSLPPNLPFLGVCLGYQMMLHAYGAKLISVSQLPEHGRQIKICKKINSRLFSPHTLQGYFVLYKSLGVPWDDSVFQKDFRLLAHENKISLAAEHVQFPHMGVQFHPESFASTGGDNLLKGFLKLVQK